MRKKLAFLASLLTFCAVSANSFGEGIIIVSPDVSQTEAVAESQAQAQPTGDMAPAGMYVGYTNVGGMTREQIENAIDQMVAKLGEQSIIINAAGKQTAIQVSQMNPVCTNKDSLVNTAIGERGYGSLVSQYKQAKDLECNNQHLEPEYSIDSSLLASCLVSQMQEIETAPKNASVSKDNNGQFVFSSAVNGFSIDYDGTYNAVMSAIRTFDGSALAEVDVVGIETAATYGDSVFEGFGSVLGSYSTEYATGGDNSNRATNVELAVSRINGTVLMPGEEFSYCAAIQPFSEEAGFKKAPTYTPSGTQMQLGGGVCQVSTTLYDAVLNAELTVSYRQNHSKTVAYTPHAMDAMVYIQSGYDFKFINSSEHAVYVEGYTTAINGNSSEIHFNIIGTETRPAGRTISYESVIKELSYIESDYGPYEIRYDDSLDMYPNGSFANNISVTYAHPAVVAEAVKHVYQDGVEVATEAVQMSWSKYTPEVGVIVINSKTTIKELKWDPETLSITGVTLSNVYLDGKEEKTTEEDSSEDESTEDESSDEESSEKDSTTVDETSTDEATTEAATTEATVEDTTTAEPTTEAPTEAPAETTTAEASADEAEATESGE